MPVGGTHKTTQKNSKPTGKKSKSITEKPHIVYHSIETIWENGSGQTRQVRVKDGKGSETVTSLPNGKTVTKTLKRGEIANLKQRNLDEFFPKLLKL